MKHDLFFEVLKKLKANPKLMRKVKFLAAVGAVGLFATGGLAIWAGISAFNYVASKTTEVIQSPTAQAQVEKLKSEAKALDRIQPLSCWMKAQSLMAVEPWLARPALDNLKNLKVACLDTKLPACNDQQCTQKDTT